MAGLTSGRLWIAPVSYTHLDVYKRQEQSGREDLSYPDIPELPEKEKLALEKAATGLYLSGHPLEAYAEKIAASGARPIGEILALAAEGAGETLEGEFVTLAGIVMTKRIKTTRSGLSLIHIF